MRRQHGERSITSRETRRREARRSTDACRGARGRSMNPMKQSSRQSLSGLLPFVSIALAASLAWAAARPSDLRAAPDVCVAAGLHAGPTPNAYGEAPVYFEATRGRP